MNDTTLDITKGVRGSDYHGFLDAVSANFNKLLADNKAPLFIIDSSIDLNAVYLSAVVESEMAEHKCRTCEHFLRNYGGLVHINEDGSLTSAVWANTDGIPAEYLGVAEALKAAVERTPVSGPFYTPVKSKLYAGNGVLGEPSKGSFRHFSVTVGPVAQVRSMRDPKKYGEDLTTREVLGESISNIKSETIATAVHSFTHDADLKNRGGFKGALELYGAFRQKLTETKDSRLRSNLIWLAAIVMPIGASRISTTTVGEYLKNVVNQPDYARRRFLEDTKSDVYQRPVAAPTSGQVALAEKLVEELGIASALKRRQATVDDIQEWLWQPTPIAEAVTTGGVFGSVVTKDAEPKAASRLVDGGNVSWTVFVRDILPTAKQITFKTPTGYDSFAGLVTAVDPDAKPILLWDKEDRRNPVSWYVYNNGSQARDFNLQSGTEVNVLGVTRSPWMWNGAVVPTMVEGVFLILAGAKDLNNTTSGLFPVILRSELYPVRGTVESYSNKTPLVQSETHASGILMAKSRNEFDPKRLIVTTETGRVGYVISRWE